MELEECIAWLNGFLQALSLLVGKTTGRHLSAGVYLHELDSSRLVESLLESLNDNLEGYEQELVQTDKGAAGETSDWLGWLENEVRAFIFGEAENGTTDDNAAELHGHMAW